MRRPKYPELRRAREGSSRVVPMDEWLAGAPAKRKGLRVASKNDIATSIEETQGMYKAHDWTAMRPRHAVALYWILHTHVYSIEPSELRGKAWTAACLMASRLLAKDFGGDHDRLVSFLAWAWKREKKAHARGGEDRRRLGWRLQFSAGLATDYRVFLAQNEECRASS